METELIPLLAQFGIAAPFVAGLGWVFKKTWERADRLEQEVVRLNGVLQDKALPALHEASTAMREMAEISNDTRTRTEIEKQVADILRAKGQIQ